MYYEVYRTHNKHSRYLLKEGHYSLLEMLLGRLMVTKEECGDQTALITSKEHVVCKMVMSPESFAFTIARSVLTRWCQQGMCIPDSEVLMITGNLGAC